MPMATEFVGAVTLVVCRLDYMGAASGERVRAYPFDSEEELREFAQSLLDEPRGYRYHFKVVCGYLRDRDVRHGVVYA